MKYKILFLCCLLAGVGGEAKKLNVLFIAADDLRMNLGCYGDTLAVTPNIDRLAAEGVRFNRAYCQFPSCNASRASLLTGMRPDSISVYRLNTNYRITAPEAITLPQHFKMNGYHTEAIGKVLHNYVLKMRDNDRAWSVPARMDKINHFRDYALEENARYKATVAECAEADDGAYVDGEITADAVETIQRLATRDQPFFLAVGFMKPHSPYNAPKKYWDLYDKTQLKALCPETPPDGVSDLNWFYPQEIRTFEDVPEQGPIPQETRIRMRHGYYAATSYLDANVGQLMDALEAAGVADETIVLLWSDHGYHLGENGHWTKVTVRELDAQVPLLVKVPGDMDGTSDAIVEYIDIFPTLSELCGLPTPQGLDGISFGQVMQNPELPLRSAALTQACRPWIGKDPIREMGYSIRTDGYRFTQWVNFKTGKILAEELYDLTTDPYQRSNRIHDGSLAEVLATHRRTMEAEVARTKN